MTDSGQIKGQIKGWCPGALIPMETGDGLVLRIRPHAGRLTAAQVRLLADLAQTHGNGLIDLGSRAHLQLRGIRAEGLPALHASLAGAGLLDPDAASEARRNILTTPIWAQDQTLALVAALEAALTDAPDLPAKFGLAVDTGAQAILYDASADLRIERARHGLILRADGMPMGEALPDDIPATMARVMDLIRWFAAHRGAAPRMAALLTIGMTPPLSPNQPPLTGAPLAPGATDFGLCLALPFGQIHAETLHYLAVAPLRLTPWRAVVLEGIASLPAHPGLIADPGHPLLRVAACTGAPGCASASVTTRDLARRLAPHLPADTRLHVSGCAKGCAHPLASALTLTGREGRFDLIVNGRAKDAPLWQNLSPDAITPETLMNASRGPLAPSL